MDGVAWDGYSCAQEAKEFPVPLLEEWGILLTPEQKKLLKAKIAIDCRVNWGEPPRKQRSTRCSY